MVSPGLDQGTVALPPHTSVYSLGPGPFPHPRPRPQRLPHTDLLSEPRGSQLHLSVKQGKCPVARLAASSLLPPSLLYHVCGEALWEQYMGPLGLAEQRGIGLWRPKGAGLASHFPTCDLGAMCHVCAPAPLLGVWRWMVMLLRFGASTTQATGSTLIGQISGRGFLPSSAPGLPVILRKSNLAQFCLTLCYSWNWSH